MIDSLREAAASLQPVEDRAFETGDTVTINARGNFVEEPEAEGVKVDNVPVVLGGPGVMEEFTQDLTGVKPDDTRSFTVEYPADYNTEGLAGKKVAYAPRPPRIPWHWVPKVMPILIPGLRIIPIMVNPFLTRPSTPGCEAEAQLNAPEVDGENEEPRRRRKPTRPTNQPSAVPLQERDKKTETETLER